MTASSIAVFDTPNEFEAGLKLDGGFDLLVTGRGRFRAKLTRIDLSRLCLLRAEEWLARIAFVSAGCGSLLIILPIGQGPPQTWNGTKLNAGEMITVGPSEGMYGWTDGPSNWGLIRASAKELFTYGRALIGPGFGTQSGVFRWHPSTASLRSLTALFNAASRVTEARPVTPIDVEAARGLEMQLISELIGCFSDSSLDAKSTSNRGQRAIMSRLEDAIQTNSNRAPRVQEMCDRLGISEQTLRICCQHQVGASPGRYLRLRTMRRVHHALLGAHPGSASAAQIARSQGITDFRRFAAAYRRLFGEPPSITIR
jgi:AraC-like DNA-binding protein